MRSLHRIVLFILIAMSGALLHAKITGTDAGRRFEYMAMDLWFHLRGAVLPNGEVVIVAIDEESYKRLNASPFKYFPRELLAEFLERAASLGVKGVAIDLVPEWESPDEEADTRLARALTLLPTALGTSTLKRKETNTAGQTIEKFIESRPNPMFARAASAVGTIMIPFEFGQVRRFPTRNFPYPRPEIPLAEEAARFFGPVTHPPSQNDFLKFYGPAGTVPHLSIYKFFDPNEAEVLKSLAGRILFVGPTLNLGAAAAGRDTYVTPYNETETFGVEIEATVTQNLISKDWIHCLPAKHEVLGQYIAVFIVSLLLMLLRPIPGGLLLLSAGGLWSIASYKSFIAGTYIPGVIAILLALPAVYVCSTFYYYLVTQRSRKQIRKAFKHYVPAQLVDQIADNPELLKQGGKLVETTTFFTDLAGFSGLAEKLPAETVASFLNRYFTEVGNIVLSEGGTLIKFIGDGIFAIWGAPLPAARAADSAKRAAMAMQERVAQLGKEFSFPMLATRIGIHHGPAIVGNLGTDKRFDYTAIGDSVNIASRLESLNKEFGTTILFSTDVWAHLTDRQGCLPIGLIGLPGREQPLLVFTSFGRPLKVGLRFACYKAWSCFKKGMWRKADEAFERIAAQEPRLAKLASIYRAELRSLSTKGIPSNWRGQIAFIKDPGFCRISTTTESSRESVEADCIENIQ